MAAHTLSGRMPARIVLMFVGLTVAAAGISLSLESELGTFPIACCPAVFSPALGLSVGTATWGMYAVFLLLQIAIERKDFKPVQVLQFAVAFLFGVLTDFFVALFSFIEPSSLPARIVVCVVGIVVLAFGISMVLKANVLMLSPDALVSVAARKVGLPFGRLKVGFDLALMSIGFVGSLVLYGGLTQIGIGTLVAAYFNGNTIRRISDWDAFNKTLDRFIGKSSE